MKKAVVIKIRLDSLPLTVGENDFMAGLLFNQLIHYLQILKYFLFIQI